MTTTTKTRESKEVMERLIRDAGVIVENFALGAMDRRGLSSDHIPKPAAPLVVSRPRIGQRSRALVGAPLGRVALTREGDSEQHHPDAEAEMQPEVCAVDGQEVGAAALVHE